MQCGFDWNVGGSKMSKPGISRRSFVKTAAYAAPAILTLSAVSSVAKAGSGDVRVKDKKPKPKKKKR